jgi:polyisoprenoid-binding protein YceI
MTKTKWILDSTHSELGFKIKHLMISHVSGSFQNFQVDAVTDNDDFNTAQIKATVAMASISTNNEQRDAHLRNSDFFEVEKYPKLTFQSTKIEKIDDDTFILFGELTLKGITKPVQLKVEHSSIINDAWGGERAGFTVTGKIKRSDWGINFGGLTEAGGLALGEDVKLNSEIQMVKQAVAVPA